MPTQTDVVIVGAGLAGLRAAQLLTQRGFTVRLVDSSDHVGGRVHSSTTDGFILDQGFQLINPSYPELVASGVLEELDLRSFAPALRFSDGETSFEVADPRYALMPNLRALGGQLAPSDAFRLSRLLLAARFTSATRLTRGADRTTLEGLLEVGLSPSVINKVLQPFLRGTMLDETLETSWHYAQLLFKSLVSGRPGTPATGVSALPLALLNSSPALQLHLHEAVTALTATSVSTNTASYSARAVLVATDQSTAAALIGTPDTGWRTQTAYWFATPQLEKSQQFRIDTKRGVWNMLDVSSVAPERAPSGRGLVVASGVGDRDDALVRSDLARLYDLDEGDVVLIERQVVTRALPKLTTPLNCTRPASRGDLFVAGDWMQTPSIQGALVSGRRAADAITEQLAT